MYIYIYEYVHIYDYYRSGPIHTISMFIYLVGLYYNTYVSTHNVGLNLCAHTANGQPLQLHVFSTYVVDDVPEHHLRVYMCVEGVCVYVHVYTCTPCVYTRA